MIDTMIDKGLEEVTITLTVEQARVVASAARQLSKKKLKEARKKPFIPQPGHFNTNERHGNLLLDAVKRIERKLDDRHR